MRNTLLAPSGGVAVKSTSWAPEAVSVMTNFAGAEGTVSQRLPMPKLTAVATSVFTYFRLAGEAGCADAGSATPSAGVVPMLRLNRRTVAVPSAGGT